MSVTIELSRQQTVAEEDLVRYMWTTGVFLEERLDPLQLELDEMYAKMKPRSRAFLLESRKIGKTLGLLMHADKMSRRNQKFITRFAYPTKTQGKTIMIPLMEEMQEDCPADLRWVNREAQEGCWYLPHTGARLYLAGADDAEQVERLRGPKSDLNILDEITTFKEGTLEYLVNSVLWPQTLNTGGLTLMSGTAPVSLDHPSVDMMALAKLKGLLITRTIFDNPRLSPSTIREICEGANPRASPEEIDEILAGKLEGTPQWEREFMCKMIADKDARVCPEFDRELHVGPAPEGFPTTRLVFIDPGFVRDFFGATFVEINFLEQMLYVRREYAALRKNTDEIRRNLIQIEKSLGWEGRQVTRYMDETAKQQIYDLTTKKYTVFPAAKSPGKGPLVVDMRNLFQADRIMVDESCKMLIGCLEDGIWTDKAKEDFKRSKAYGHLDVMDALAQGCMTIRQLGKWQTNPYPKNASQQYYTPGLSRDEAKNKTISLTNTRSLGYHVSKLLPGRRR